MKMRRIVAGILGGLLVLNGNYMAVQAAETDDAVTDEEAVDFYVSPDGDDSNPGSENAPFQSLSRANHGFPHIPFQPLNQQEFNVSARHRLSSEQSGGNYPGIVQDHAVSRFQIVQNVVKMTVLNAVLLPVQNHQPAGISLLRRGLSNQLLRQVIIKIF